MLKSKTVIIPFLITMLMLTSCTVISVIPVGGNNSGLSANRIPVYTSRDAVNQEFEEIAIITAKVDAEFGPSDDAETMNKVLNKAQMIGADAVIFEEEDYASMRVTAIKFKK